MFLFPFAAAPLSIPGSPGRSSGVFAALILGAVFTLIMMAGALIEPAPVRAVNTQAQFDTARAFDRIVRILGDEAPHPVDHPQNARVRNRLMTVIREMGFEPEETTHHVCDAEVARQYIGCAKVTNVSFAIGSQTPATASRDTLLLLAHYDSVPAGPGAGDDMIGVATILEIAHHLKREQPERPVLMMFTDGEEFGLFGAKAFVEQDPRFDRIETILNFEARGVGGPVFMFETSQPNDYLIQRFKEGASRPAATSTMAAVYEAMPNGTDMTEFLGKGIHALNFSAIRNERYYHTPRDTLANLSKASLQHMGDQGLGTARAFLATDRAQDTRRLLYTDIFGRILIVTPFALTLPLLLVSLLVAAFLVARRLGDGALAPRVITIFLPLIVLLIACGFSFMVQLTVKLLRADGLYWIAHGWATQGFAVLCALWAVAMLSRYAGRLGTGSVLNAAAWFWFLVLGLVCTFLLPGGAILFVVPALGCLTASTLSIVRPGLALWVYAAAAVITLSVWAPTLGLLGSALGFGLSAAITAIAAIATWPVLGVLGLMADTPTEQAHPQRRLSLATVGTAGALATFTLLALSLPKYTETAPRHLNVNHYTDQISGNSFVAFLTRGPDNPPPPQALLIRDGREARALTFGPKLTNTDYPYWSFPAAPFLSEPDSITAAPNLVSGEGVNVTLTAGGFPVDRMTIQIPGTMVVSSVTYGTSSYATVSAETKTGPTVIRCFGQSCLTDGITLTMDAPATGEQTQALTVLLDRYGTTDATQGFATNRDSKTVPRQLGDRHTSVIEVPLSIAPPTPN